MKSLLVVFLSLFLGYANGQGDALEPVKWSFEVEKTGDNEFKLIYKADIENGWAIYSQHIADGGPIPTSFTVEENGGVEFVGDVVEPKDQESKYDEMFDMDLIKIKGSVEFFQMVKTSSKSPTVKGFLTFMSCDDSKCLPPNDIEFEFVVE